MNVLDSLPEDKKNILVSLPYRVGYWISQSDTHGGSDADMQELQTLSNIIHGFAEDVFGSELVQYIMRETLNNESQWPNWAEDLDDVLLDCEEAVDILIRLSGQKDVDAFGQRLMEIGEAVALAFREYGSQDSFVEKLKIYIAYGLGRYRAMKAKQSYKTLDEFLNISLKERQALIDLSKALDKQYI